jgi:oligopeptide/dipeptide ABC transporter ATP-binding protein
LIEVKGLTKIFELEKNWRHRNTKKVKAVDGIDLSIAQGETLGLVGESGCGKSTVGRLLVRLITPSNGEIFFNGQNTAELTGHAMKDFRRNVQMIFQDSFSSLNPRMTVARILGEGLKIHRLAKTARDMKEILQKTLNDVGLHPEDLFRHSHTFSGGQRQRINIARALCLKPRLIICDEPISALDVSIQAQIINLLNQVKRKYNLSYLFISHDLSVIKHMSDRVAVMYLGKIVELASKQSLFASPMHPYTQALISVIPNPDPTAKRAKVKLFGEISPMSDQSGCKFANRCYRVKEICYTSPPELVEVKPGHKAACHLIS